MQLFKHAYFSLKHNKIQWLIKFLFLFTYLSLVFGLVDSISNFKREIDRSKNKYATQVQIFPNSEGAGELTYKELENYGLSDYIDRIEYDGYLYLQPVKNSEQLLAGQRTTASALTSMIGVLPTKELTRIMKEISFDMPELKAGECLISQSYADTENIRVGDVVSYYNDQSQVDFTVKGIYKPKVEVIYLAHIYLTSESLEAVEPELYQQTLWHSVYHLADSEAFDDFSSEVREKGLSEQYQIVSNESLYHEETVFLNEALKRAGYCLSGTLLIGLIPLYLVASLFKRKQTAEIGFLYSNGISKRKISLMYCSNDLLLLIAASFLAFVLMKGCISSLTEFLLNGTIESVTSQTVSFFSTNNFSVTTSIAEPIKTVASSTTLAPTKFGLLFLLWLILSAGKINEVRRFQFGTRLTEEME
ncbi:hypothetical protein I6N96_06680 [Enterococcus sp. BWM-S5]|uniref:ABC transporter permease n=1 Tax=Enterococcus larvae TaxID=2794352 RepID=A0ABS4CH63_9ENTE|nr:hypothetical protein [Enterococcus larvae]MBP1045961.1 hypothetical protein [Enterococcus larvae]